MSDSALVLDNSVLSALFTAGWFDAPSFYWPERTILVSTHVWNNEFTQYHDIEEEREWITVREPDLESVRTQALGQLSKPDWSCIALAEQAEADSTVVTNDRNLREVVNRRNGNAEWGTHFALRTFEACGISISDFRDGLDRYLADVTLPSEVQAEIRSAEK